MENKGQNGEKMKRDMDGWIRTERRRLSMAKEKKVKGEED